MVWSRFGRVLSSLLMVVLVVGMGIPTTAWGEVCPELAGRSMLSSTNIPWLEDAVFDRRYTFGTDAFGLAVWDLVDPDNPVHLAHWEAPQRAQGVALGPGDLVPCLRLGHRQPVREPGVHSSCELNSGLQTLHLINLPLDGKTAGIILALQFSDTARPSEFRNNRTDTRPPAVALSTLVVHAR